MKDKGETKEKEQRAVWADPVIKPYLCDGKGRQIEETVYNTYVDSYGYGWRVDENLKTYCIGKVKVENGVTIPLENSPQTPPDAPKPVAKIATGNNPLPVASHEGIMQQKNGRGRPIKRGEVHRATEWRRKKKGLQGVLL